jgi:hypothetical protein
MAGALGQLARKILLTALEDEEEMRRPPLPSSRLRPLVDPGMVAGGETEAKNGRIALDQYSRTPNWNPEAQGVPLRRRIDFSLPDSAPQSEVAYAPPVLSRQLRPALVAQEQDMLPPPPVHRKVGEFSRPVRRIEAPQEVTQGNVVQPDTAPLTRRLALPPPVLADDPPEMLPIARQKPVAPTVQGESNAPRLGIERGVPAGQIAATETPEQLYRRGEADMGARAAPAVQPMKPEQFTRWEKSLDERLAKLEELETSPVKDKNGRVRSALWGALLGLLRGGIGGAIGGGLVGVFKPDFDEKLKRVQDIAKARNDVDAVMEIGKARAQIEEMRARSENLRGKNEPGAVDARSRAAAMRELQGRMKMTGNRFDPSDARSVELAQSLSITPRTKGSSFNPQRLKVVDDNLVYVDFDEEGRMVMDVIQTRDGKPLPPKEAERIRNAIQLEGVNVQRGRVGQPPLMINSGDAPATTSPASAPSVRDPKFGAIPGAVEDTPSLTRPALTPVPGATAPLARGGYRRGSYRGRSSGRASSDAKGEQIANTSVISTVRDIEEATAAASASARRGDLQGKRDNLRRAQVLADTLKNNPNTRSRVRVGGQKDAQGDYWPSVQQERSHAVPAPAFDAAVQQVMEEYGATKEVAASWLKQGGYAPHRGR